MTATQLAPEVEKDPGSSMKDKYNGTSTTLVYLGDIDSNNHIFKYHTITEAKYRKDKEKFLVQVRVPVNPVIKARNQFLEDKKVNSHIDLESQVYQIHLFNGTNKDYYINNVDFNGVKDLLAYFDKNQNAISILIKTNDSVDFSDFKEKVEFGERPEHIGLHIGHEKYGVLDLVSDHAEFNLAQMYRVVLYSDFLNKIGYGVKKDEIEHELSGYAKEKVHNGCSLEQTCNEELKNICNRSDGEYTLHSMFESFSLVIDGGNDRLNQVNLKVCNNNKNHTIPLYWTIYEKRRVYRVVDKHNLDADIIQKSLEGVLEKECPKCKDIRLKN